MAPIKLQRIVSCSSQDPAFPAENLLKSGTNHHWKCKAGEKTAVVVIQLAESSTISGIDVGNASSAFVEVLVGRESVPDEFKVLLVMSSFMTPMDSRNEEQTNMVRIFQKEHLQPECQEKWDRIKIVCTQPYNKFLKFGLAFITLHQSQEVPESAAPSLLGRFTIKDDDDDISVGSIFARRKEEPEAEPKPPSAAGSWRDAAKASSSKADQEKPKAPKKNVTPKAESKKNATPKAESKKNATPKAESKKNATPKAESKKNATPKAESKKTPSNEDAEKKKMPKAVAPNLPTKRPNSDEAGSSPRQKKQMKVSPNVNYKPFNKLLEDVEFAISGYVNPGRADIRSKALEMGAKYRPDWTPTCSHLICAFANTPKFQQVKGKGKIVVRDWIDDCYNERKKLPWRRYAVDKDDKAGSSSADEPEVWELIQDKEEPRVVARRNALSGEDARTGARSSESSSDTDDEIDRVLAQLKKKAEAVKNEITSNQKAKSEKEDEPCTESAFTVSTDEDSGDESPKDKLKNGLPELPTIFKNKYFYIHSSLSRDQIEKVERYIIAFGGTLCEILDDDVHYVIAERKDDDEEDAPGVFYVKPVWIWDCNDAGRLVPFQEYAL